VVAQQPEEQAGKTPSQRIDELVHLPVEELVKMPAPYNPRVIDKLELKRLRDSIVYFGAVDPMLVNDRTGNIVDGHQRLKAAIEEGLDTFPVIRIDVDEIAERQLNLALNRISGIWDDEKLRDLLGELDDLDANLELTGFTDDELEKLLSDPVLPDFGDQAEPEVSEVTVVIKCTREFHESIAHHLAEWGADDAVALFIS